MAGQPSSSSDLFFPHSHPSNPSFMEDAMASLRFDNTANNSSSYNPEIPTTVAVFAAAPPRMQPVAQQQQQANPNNPPAVNADPVPGDPDAVFIRAPFTDFPGSSERKTGLSFSDLAANPNWFLFVDDFIGPNAVGYPPQLEPPRGWCPAKKKDMKEWKEGEGPRLRCTLCRRSYSGVNAKSMWRRHVYEKHKIAMANRRDTNDRPAGGRGGRSSNKENKASSSSKSAEKVAGNRPAPKALRRAKSMEDEASTSGLGAPPAEPLTATHTHENTPDDAHLGEEEHSFVEGPSFSSTPPQTPGPSDSQAPSYSIVVPPESPYNPLMTPAFRHSPARMPSKQIWRFSSPKLGHKARDYTLAMLARGEASPNVRGLDVSPIVLVPASERQKRSIFSPPRKSALAVSPRRLFSESAEGDSIQSRLDEPGWAALLTPGKVLSSNLMETPGRDLLSAPSELEEYMQDWIESGSAPGESLDNPSAPLSTSTPYRVQANSEGSKNDHFTWSVGSLIPPSPIPTAQFTPRTKMFINGIVSPPKGPDSSPIPCLSAGPSTGSRGRRDSLSPSPKMPSIPFTPLLPPFSEDGVSSSGPSASSVVVTPDVSMELEDEVAIAEPYTSSFSKPYRSLTSWHDLFNPGASSSARGDGEPHKFPPTSLSGSFSLSSLSQSHKAHSPSLSNDRGRGRSASNAGSASANTSISSSGQKSSIGLMDAVLDKKSRRRKHSHSELRGEGEVGVTAMGSPFKMSRKTSRSELLYSVDGDCEMQDPQPKKRRKTISGRD